MTTKAEFRRAGYYGRAWVLLQAGGVRNADWPDNYRVDASDGKHEYDVSFADPVYPTCSCKEYKRNHELHMAALHGKDVQCVGLTCKHILAAKAQRGELDLVDAIKAMPEPMRQRARVAAKAARQN